MPKLLFLKAVWLAVPVFTALTVVHIVRRLGVLGRNLIPGTSSYSTLRRRDSARTYNIQAKKIDSCTAKQSDMLVLVHNAQVLAFVGTPDRRGWFGCSSPGNRGVTTFYDGLFQRWRGRNDHSESKEQNKKAADDDNHFCTWLR